MHRANREARDEHNKKRRQAAEKARAARIAFEAAEEASSSNGGDTSNGGGNDNNNNDNDEAKIADVTRIWGSTKLSAVVESAITFSNEADIAKVLDADRWKEVKNLIKDVSELFDTGEKEEQLASFMAGLDKEGRMTAKELEVGFDITAALCGAVVLLKIQSGLGHEEHLDAELATRNVVKFTNKEGIENRRQ